MIQKLWKKLRGKRIKTNAFIVDDGDLVQTDFNPKPEPKTSPKPKRKRKTLTREEMWEIMCDHFEIFKSFRLHPKNMGDEYIHREKLWNFLVNTGLNKSPRLTEEQREKIKREIVNRI